MIHYHGTPIGGPSDFAARILKGRHAFVSFAGASQIRLVAQQCSTFALDNGAFTYWRNKQKKIKWSEYFQFVDEWQRHPGFDFAIIPDDIADGTEEANDKLIKEWPFQNGVPVWHLHESLDKLGRLAEDYEMVALGSSGDYSRVGDSFWWPRISEAMERITVEGQPITKLHGLRMLDPDIYTKIPLHSADSTNAARNVTNHDRWKGSYAPASMEVRASVLIDRIEFFNSAQTWNPRNVQMSLFQTEGL